MSPARAGTSRRDRVRLVLVPLPHLHSVSIAVWLRGGPRYEGKRESGLTHLLEHMLFRGAGAREPRALMAAFEALGAEPYAHTGDDELGLLASVEPARAAAAARLLSQVLLRPRFRDLDREKRIVREELLDLLDEKGNPADLDDVARALVFGHHPLGRPIVGRDREVQGYGRRDLERLRARLVRSENVVVAVAGPVGPALARAVSRAFGSVPVGPAPADAAPLPVEWGPRVRFVPYAASESCDVRLSFLGPGEADAASPALQLLASVLDGGPRARLPERLVDAGYVHAAGASLVPFPDLALLEVDFTVSGRRLAATTRRALDVVRSVAREGVTRAELTRARERLLRRRRLSRDDAAAEAEWAARRALHGLDPSRQAEARAIAAVTPAQVRAVARHVLEPERFAAVVLGSPPVRQRRETRRLLLAPVRTRTTPPRARRSR